jgi:ATP-dependent Lhr-like helicase
MLGPLAEPEIAVRSVEGLDAAMVLAELAATRRAVSVRIAGETRWADPADAAVLRDALGTPLPTGIAASFLEAVPDPLGRLIGRFARTRGPFTAAEPAARFGLGIAVVTDALRRLVSAGRVAEGEFRPAGSVSIDGVPAGEGREFVDAGVLRLLRRRSLAALRAEIEPVAAVTLGRFLPAWNAIGATGSSRLHGSDGVFRAVEQLAGAVLPASALESLILPARVPGYTPAMLDELTASGDVLWAGHGSLAGDDGWLSLHLAETAALTLPLPDDQDGDPMPGGPVHRSILGVLATGGGFFFGTLADGVRADLAPSRPDEKGERSVSDAELVDALWDLVFAGLVSGDTLAPLRARLAGGRTAHRSRSAARPRTRRMGGLSALAARPGAAGTAPRRAVPPSAVGRWSLVPIGRTDPTIRAHAAAEILLDRHGIVTRGSVVAEGTPGGFAGVYRVLSAFEESGRARRGYFVEGLGAAQFGTAGAVDRLRALAPALDRDEVAGRVIVLAAADPANPYGAALPWPAGPDAAAVDQRHRPARRAGALVVLVDGQAVLFAERGGRSVLTFSTDSDELGRAAVGLAELVQQGRIGGLTVARVDGAEALTSRGRPLDALTDAGFMMTPRGLRLRRTAR